MRIVVELKKATPSPRLSSTSSTSTPRCQSTFSIINIVLVNRRSRTLSLRETMVEYIAHRKEVIRRRTPFLLRRARQRAHILEGLILALADIDAIIQIIKRSPDVPMARQNLMGHPLKLLDDATGNWYQRLLQSKRLEKADQIRQLLKTEFMIRA